MREKGGEKRGGGTWKEKKNQLLDKGIQKRRGKKGKTDIEGRDIGGEVNSDEAVKRQFTSEDRKHEGGWFKGERGRRRRKKVEKMWIPRKRMFSVGTSQMS